MQQRIAALDRPLIALAGFAVLLYLGELFRVFPPSLRPALIWANFLVDSVFVVDLITKCVVLGRSYLRSPWFLIDLISTLPIFSSTIELLELIGPQVQFFSAVRVTRAARLGRTSRLAGIARVARVARALRIARGLVFLKSLPTELQQTPTFNRSLKIGVPALLVAFVSISYYFQHVELTQLRRDLRARVERARDLDEIRKMPEYIPPPGEGRRGARLRMEREIGGQQVALAFSLEQALVNSDRVQGLLLILVLLTVVSVVFISSSLSRDRRRTTELALLGQCFSPPIVDKFFASPDVLQRYYEQWMSVFFIDVRGFTAATQQHRDDIEGLAVRLRRVMDIARRQIVVTFEGVVDKFMGDAVMGWFGGHFSRHWTPLAPLRRSLLLDELEEASADVATLHRELSPLEERRDRGALDDAGGRQAAELRAALDEAEARFSELRARHEELRRTTPDLVAQHDAAHDAYRRAVARAGVQCLLKIVDEVAAQPERDAFREIKVGMASGSICVGNFGSTEQVGFTILGPTVNRAARLEPASVQCGCRVLIDRETRQLADGAEGIVFRTWGTIDVKGIEGPLLVYEPLAASADTEAFLPLFEQGRESAGSGALDEALALFERADRARTGGDAASRVWIERLNRARANGETAIGVYHATKG
jgi:class 3 adenylate cyclase